MFSDLANLILRCVAIFLRLSRIFAQLYKVEQPHLLLFLVQYVSFQTNLIFLAYSFYLGLFLNNFPNNMSTVKGQTYLINNNVKLLVKMKNVIVILYWLIFNSHLWLVSFLKY